MIRTTDHVVAYVVSDTNAGDCDVTPYSLIDKY